MPRMHGERAQDYEARRRHAVESAVATRAKLWEWQVLQDNGVPIAKQEVTGACSCSFLPFAHFHDERERLRFERRMPPGGVRHAY